MRKLLLSSIIFFSLFLFLLASAKFVSAQGTHDCRWYSIAGGRPSCHVYNMNCESGYDPDFAHCSQFNPSGDEAGCNAQIGVSCIERDTAESTCEARGRRKGIRSAIGCIPVENQNDFIRFILGWGMGIAGGAAFLLIVVAGFQIITSSGDPKRLQAGKELLTAAIAGLVLLIFSLFILRLIGVDVLGILPEI